MTITREKIEEIVDSLWERVDPGNWEEWAAFFSEDCTFMTSAFSEPIVGRAELLRAIEFFPKVVNKREWVVIDGRRLVVGWRERKVGSPETSPWFKGVSSFLFNESGYIQEYEGTFNVQQSVVAPDPVD